MAVACRLFHKFCLQSLESAGFLKFCAPTHVYRLPQGKVLLPFGQKNESDTTVLYSGSAGLHLSDFTKLPAIANSRPTAALPYIAVLEILSVLHTGLFVWFLDVLVNYSAIPQTGPKTDV